MWIVAQCRPHAESVARFNLIEQKYEVFLPEYLKRRTHARKVDVVPMPLFPGYIFCNVQGVQPWSPINGTRGILRVLSSGNYVPLECPLAVIDDIKAQIGPNGYIGNDPEKFDAFRPDQQVRINGGSFSGLHGLYVGVARDRISILLDIMGRRTVVNVKSTMVEAVA